jgi:hypothetical protein
LLGQGQHSSNYNAPHDYFSGSSKDKAKIVQFADEAKTLPDGSRIVYAENEEKIVLYQKMPDKKGTTYVYDRKTGLILVNGKEGTIKDKRDMISLGTYMLGNCKESDMVTITVQKT